MFIVRINEYGFIPSDDHTVGYNEMMRRWIGNGTLIHIRPYCKAINPQTAMFAIDDTFNGALDQVRIHFGEFVKNIPSLTANLSDIYITALHEEVKDSIFMLPSISYDAKYRLSDGMIVKLHND